jgi:hypothetical protein
MGENTEEKKKRSSYGLLWNERFNGKSPKRQNHSTSGNDKTAILDWQRMTKKTTTIQLKF